MAVVAEDEEGRLAVLPCEGSGVAILLDAPAPGMGCVETEGGLVAVVVGGAVPEATGRRGRGGRTEGSVLRGGRGWRVFLDGVREVVVVLVVEGAACLVDVLDADEVEGGTGTSIVFFAASGVLAVDGAPEEDGVRFLLIEEEEEEEGPSRGVSYVPKLEECG